MKFVYFHVIFLIIVLLSVVSSRRHRLVLKNDGRGNILCSQFGFLKYGLLSVNMEKLKFNSKSKIPQIGFTLDKSENAGIASYLETKSKKCVLTDPSIIKGSTLSVVYFRFDFEEKRLIVSRIGKDLKKLSISPVAYHDPTISSVKPSASPTSEATDSPARRTRRDNSDNAKSVKSEVVQKFSDMLEKLGIKISLNDVRLVIKDMLATNMTASDLSDALDRKTKAFKTYAISVLEAVKSKTTHATVSDKLLSDLQPQEMKHEQRDEGDVDWSQLSEMKNDSIPLRFVKGHYSMEFLVTMVNVDDEGLYSLYFHNCDGQEVPVNMTLSLVEKNRNSYLSAGAQPLPLVYFAFCGAYFVLSWVWLVVLRTSKKDVFKIHYVMLALVFVKSVALLFHGINNYVLGKEGIHEEGWAVMYYITYLMRGSLMLITLILIGTGWTYVKHMLHDREKKILLVGMSLHALRFVANIITGESEIGSARYMTWKEIFILVDLLSIGLVLFPIVWSIRHLTKASRTDGKAAVNLRRLKLFRHFYLIVICFIYTSRIIAYLLTITIPFTHSWLVELFKEGATLIFFIITGYKFRPFNNNPYLLVPDVDLDDENDEMEVIVAQSAYAENTSRVQRSNNQDDDEIADTVLEVTDNVKPAVSINSHQVISHEED